MAKGTKKIDYKLYTVWSSMKRRCRENNGRVYKSYKARGITFCEVWEKFENFHAWALESGYKEGLSLDRRDNSKSYNPENCRWATRAQQQNNRQNSISITYKGQTRSLKNWAIHLNMAYDTLLKRLNRHCWTVEQAFETPVRKRRDFHG